MERSPMTRTTVTTWCLLAIMGLAGQASADDRFIEQIRAAWQARQDRLRSFEIEWDGIALDLSAKPPVERVTHYRLACDGTKARLERHGPAPHVSGPGGVFVERDHSVVYNGVDRRMMFNGPDHGNHPAGFLNSQKGFADSDENQYSILGALLSFRPLSLKLGGIDLAAYHVSDRRGSINGVPCRILERQVHPTSVKRVWVADGEDFRIMRQELVRPRHALYQLTLMYEPHDALGLVIRSWSNVVYDRDGKAAETMTVKVTALALNERIDASEFEYEFPPGTIVENETSRQTGVVREDGTVRVVTPGELASGGGWDRFMTSSAPPEALAFDGGSQRPIWPYLAAGIAALAAGAWTWRRRARGVSKR